MKLFEPIERELKIAQKTIQHRPVDKLMDGYIAILAGAAGMVEVNKFCWPMFTSMISTAAGSKFN